MSDVTSQNEAEAFANSNVPTQSGPSVAAMMDGIGKAARAASRELLTVSREQKDQALLTVADLLMQNVDAILAENQTDLKRAKEKDLRGSFIDRLMLDEARVAAMAQSLREIAQLDDPVGSIADEWQRPNGMRIRRVRSPLGVIGMIYEARPNVTIDAAALCLKSGNAAILRAGSDSFNSSAILAKIFSDGMESAGICKTAAQIIPSTDREAVGLLLGGLGGNVDVIVPRGGRSLVERVQVEARVPVFSHLDGICHVYVHASANIDTAVSVTLNAKMRRTGICGAAETLLVDQSIAAKFLPVLCTALADAGCEVRGDATVQRIVGGINPASEEDWSTEYLDAVITVGVVNGVAEAAKHIGEYGSGHTEAIIAQDSAAVQQFMASVDSAIVMHNASTQFADGGEFGMGAEIGISTGRFHARGPIGLQQLTVMKYLVFGEGQCRP